jgi:hypothetical protein
MIFRALGGAWVLDLDSPKWGPIWGKDLLFFFLEGDFKEDLYRGAAPSPAQGTRPLGAPCGVKGVHGLLLKRGLLAPGARL